MSKNQVTKEQIAQAKQIDLLSYLQANEPSELISLSNRVYTTKSHNSLKISNGKWCWWSQNIGGKNALDYLIKVRGMGFVDAVECLLNCSEYHPPPIKFAEKPPPKPPFTLPKAYINNDRVVRYLQSRGIGIELISECISQRKLYEDEKHNCCFVGYDGVIPKYAMLRSSNPNSTFLREADGSDKRFSFRLPEQKDSNRLLIFESPIDSLSYAELEIMGGKWKPYNYLSLSGVYQPRNDCAELPIALTQFLQDNPQINHINICLDADKTGRLAAKAIANNLPQGITSTIMLPTKGKDYNEQLQITKGIKSYVKTRNSNEEEFSR